MVFPLWPGHHSKCWSSVASAWCLANTNAKGIYSVNSHFLHFLKAQNGKYFLTKLTGLWRIMNHVQVKTAAAITAS